jgi:hypothetical protein
MAAQDGSTIAKKVIPVKEAADSSTQRYTPETMKSAEIRITSSSSKET